MRTHHVHVDGKMIDKAFVAKLKAIGFVPDDFISGRHAPTVHLVFETKNRRQFLWTAEECVRLAAEHPDWLQGYIECENVRTWVVGSSGELKNLQLPFRIQETVGIPDGGFRAAEIHVTFALEDADPRLRSALAEIGLFPATFRRSADGRIGEVWTCQWQDRRLTGIIPKLIVDWLWKVGGTASGLTVELETISHWWVSEGARLPPVIERIIV